MAQAPVLPDDEADAIKAKYGHLVIGHLPDGTPHYARELVFTHLDSEGVVRHFAIEKMNAVAPLRGYPIMKIAMDLWTYEMIRDNMGIEDHRLERLEPQHCLTPTIWCQLPERPTNGAQATAIMVDGSHRYCAAWGRFGWKAIPGYLFPVGDWEEFLVTMSDELSSFSANQIREGIANGTTHWSGIK